MNYDLRLQLNPQTRTNPMSKNCTPVPEFDPPSRFEWFLFACLAMSFAALLSRGLWAFLKDLGLV